MPDQSPVIGQIPANNAPEAHEATDELITAAASDGGPKPIRALPTDRLTHAKQLDLLRAFAVLGESGRAVTNGEVANLTKFNSSTVAYNNPFFGEVGLLIKGGNGHTPSPELIEYGRALQFEDDKAGFRLAPVLRRSWFGDFIVRKVLFRSMAEKDAITELGIMAKAGAKHEAQLRLLLDYLQFAGLISRDGGMVAVGPTAKEQRIPDQDAGPAMAEPLPRREASAGVSTTFNHVPEGTIAFSVNVNVPLNEMATWRPEVVAAFFAGVAQVVSAKAAVERTLGGSKSQ